MRNVVLAGAVLIAFVSVAFGQWEPDVRLSSCDSLRSWVAQNARSIAADSDHVHVVWQDSRFGGRNTEGYYIRSTDGGASWGSETRMTENDSVSEDPAIAISGPVVHVIWVDERDSYRGDVYYKRSSDNGATWGADTALTTVFARKMEVSIAASGQNVHVMWADARDPYYDILYKRSSDGGMTWSEDTQLVDVNSESYMPAIAVSDSHVHMVWFDRRHGVREEVYYKRSTDNGLTWGPDTRMTEDPEDSEWPVIAAVGADVHVLWSDNRDGDHEVYYQHSSDNGETWDDVLVLTDDTYTSCATGLAASGDCVHAVWTDHRHGDTELYYRRSVDRGLNWGPEVRLTEHEEDGWAASMAASGSGVHVVWYDERDGNEEVYYKRNPTGSAVWGAPAVEVPRPTSPTILRGVELARFPGRVVDVQGRDVTEQKGALRPGVYFVRTKGPRGQGSEGPTLKVILTR